MKKLGLEKYFISIVDGSMVDKAKPDPEIFKRCMEELKLKNNEVLIVEDSMNGIEAGNKIGIDCCGKNICSKEVKYTIKNLRDILDIVG